VLHIVAWSSQASILGPINNPFHRSSRYKALVDVENKGPRTIELELNSGGLRRNEACFGIHLGTGDEWTPFEPNVLFLLIVQECEAGSSVYERVGLGTIRMDFEDYKVDNPLTVPRSAVVPARGLPLPKLVKRRQEFWIH
jgi:hypothetical protein